MGGGGGGGARGGTLGLITATSYLLLHLLKKIGNEQKFDRSTWYLDNTHAANANLRGTEIPCKLVFYAQSTIKVISGRYWREKTGFGEKNKK